MRGKIANIGENPFVRVVGIAGFRHLWLGQIASQLAFASLMFVLSLRVYQITGSNAAVSLLFLTFGVPALLLAVAAGAIDDYLDNRSVLVFCDVFRAVAVLGFMLFPTNLMIVYAIAFIMTVTNQFYVPAEIPTIPLLVPEPFLLTANSLFSLTYYTSLALGSMLAGPILRGFGPYGVFVVISALFFLAAWQVSHIPKEKDGRIGRLVHLRDDLGSITSSIACAVGEGWAYVAGSKTVRDALLLLAGTQVIVVLLGTLGPGFADRVLEIDIHDASLFIVGPVAAGIVMGALWVGGKGNLIRRETLIRIGITAAGILLMLIAITVRLERVPAFSWLFAKHVILPVEFLLFFLLGVANSMLDVPANSILQGEASVAMRSRVYGILTMAVGGVGILPVVGSGLLADVIGEGKVIFLLGLVILLYGLWRVRYNRNKS